MHPELRGWPSYNVNAIAAQIRDTKSVQNRRTGALPVLVKKKGTTGAVREQWLSFVHEEMEIMYDQCTAAVLVTSSSLRK